MSIREEYEYFLDKIGEVIMTAVFGDFEDYKELRERETFSKIRTDLVKVL